jgi:hypothetical protein
MPFSAPPRDTITSSDISDWASATAAFLTSIPATLTNKVLASPTITGVASNSGTIAGGTVSPAVLLVGDATNEVKVSITSGTDGNPLCLFAKTGSGTAQTNYQLRTYGNGYIQFADPSMLPTAAGAGAVDLQVQRGAPSHTASGVNSAVLGGRSNTASGTRSTVVGGYNNTASGQGSVALGQGATDNGANATIVFAGGNTGQGVINQQLSAITSSGGSARLTSDGQVAGAYNVLNIPNNSVAGGRLIVVARNPSDGTAALWDLDLLYWAAGNAITVQAPGTAAIAPTSSSPSLSTASLTVTADTAHLGINITYQSPASVSSRVSASFIGQQQT